MTDEVRLPSLACGPCAEGPGFLYCAPSSANRPQGNHPSPQNQKVKVTSSVANSTEGGLRSECA